MAAYGDSQRVTSMLSAPSQAPATRSSHVPFPTSKHRVTKGRYITSKDPRGYIPVYEYLLNGHWLMMDVDDGYVLWTGIWKALGHPKADIVKMIESLPELSSRLRRVRGGYLKIQGTWLPFEYAISLARRVAWPIRDDLVPFFGPTFPDSCLSPSDQGYGRILPPTNGRRKRRSTQTQEEQASFAVMPRDPFSPSEQYPSPQEYDSHQSPLRIYTGPEVGRYSPYPRHGTASTTSSTKYISPISASPMYAEERRMWPIGGASSSNSSASVSTRSSPVSPLPFNPQQRSAERPTLPSLSSLSLLPAKALPPISSITSSSDAHDRRSGRQAVGIPDPASVLRRLRLDDSLPGEQRYHNTY